MTRTARRNEQGRLEVSDEVLLSHAWGVLIAISMSPDAIMRRLGCDRFEAEAFLDGARADWSRIERLRGVSRPWLA